MKSNLDEEEIRQVKEIFDGYLEVVDRAKEISTERSALVENLSRIIDTKKGVAGKILKAMAKKYEGEVADEEEVCDMLQIITGNAEN